jgi:hypothetical protein
VQRVCSVCKQWWVVRGQVPALPGALVRAVAAGFAYHQPDDPVVALTVFTVWLVWRLCS